MRRILIVLGLTLAFAAPSVANAADDTDAPVIVAAVLNPTTVDVTEASQHVQATVRVTDATGVKAVAGTLKSATTNQETPLTFGVGVLGTKTDGYWRITFTIPQGAAPGDWQLRVRTLDDAGNQGSSDGAPEGFMPSVDVTSVENPDDAGPELVSTEATPTAVEVGPSAQDITVSFHVTDATGTAHVIASLRSVSSDEATPNQQAELVSGTAQDGTWETTFTIPKGAAPGDWQVRILAMDDTLGNIGTGLFLPPEKLAIVQVTSAHAPSQVTDVRATGKDASATVTWTAPAANGLPITSYEITATPGDLTKTVAGDQTSVDFDGLTNGTAYTFTVVAVNDVGPSTVSAPSNAVTPNFVFETGPTATITGDLQTGATLTADEGDTSPEPDSYTYQWFADDVAIEGATGKTFTLTSAQLGHKITVKVTAVKENYVPVSDVSDPTGVVGKALDVAVAKDVVLTGRSVKVTATGLTKLENYTITIGGVVAKSYHASYSGTVAAYVRVPDSVPDGPAEVVVKAASGLYGTTSLYNAQPEKSFTVVPSDESAARGSLTSVTVTGMAPGERVRVTFGGSGVSPYGAVADANGSYTLSYSVGNRLGDRQLKVTGMYYKRTGFATVTVTP